MLNCYIPIGLWEHLRDETNIYFHQKHPEPEAERTGRAKLWVDTTVPEMKRYFVCMLCIGLKKPNEIRELWGTDPLFKCELVRSIMTLKRFEQLNAYLHFANDEERQANDVLSKIRPVYDWIVGRIESVHTPLSKHITVDEILTGFTSKKNPMRVYMPNKRHSHGCRSYLAVDDKKHVVKFRIDDLKAIEPGPGANLPAEFGNTDKLVAMMLEDLLDKYYSLCCDQFFTSAPLFAWLLSRKTQATGTLKANRKFTSKSLKVKKRPRDDIMSRQAGEITQIRYQATKTKAVRILTTEHNADTEMVTIRRKDQNGAWQEVQVPKPVVITHTYNFKKVNVDVVDQLMSYNSMLRRTSSYAHKLVMLMFDILLTNGHSLWKHYTEPQGHRAYGRHYRRLLIDQLLADANRVDPRPAVGSKRKHVLAKLEGSKRKRCKVCLTLGKKDSRSRYFCSGCAEKPALCVTHFAQFHK